MVFKGTIMYRRSSECICRRLPCSERRRLVFSSKWDHGTRPLNKLQTAALLVIANENDLKCPTVAEIHSVLVCLQPQFKLVCMQEACYFHRSNWTKTTLRSCCCCCSSITSCSCNLHPSYSKCCEGSSVHDNNTNSKMRRKVHKIDRRMVLIAVVCILLVRGFAIAATSASGGIGRSNNNGGSSSTTARVSFYCTIETGKASCGFPRRSHRNNLGRLRLCFMHWNPANVVLRLSYAD